MAVEINPQFQGDKEGFVAFSWVEQETLEAGGNSLAHSPSGFVRCALSQGLQLFVGHPGKSQGFPPSVSPAEFNRKTPVFPINVPPPSRRFRQDGLQPLRGLVTGESII